MLWVANLVVLVVLRRWRHLFVWIGVALVVVNFGATMLATLQRPRPFEVELLGRWAGYSMPSLPMTVLAAFLVSTLYSLVPAGRHRGRWASGWSARCSRSPPLSRLYLAQDHPTDILAGAILGVAVPLAAFRLLTPNDVYPVRYRRGRTAHLDVTGARGEAIVRALQDQLGLLVTSVASRSTWPGRVARPRCGSAVKADDGERRAAASSASSTRPPTCAPTAGTSSGRTLLYGRLEDEQPFHSVRRLVQYEDYVLHLLADAGLPVPRPLGIVEITPEREYLLVTEFIDGAARDRGGRGGRARSSTRACRSSGGCGRSAWPTATSSRPTSSSGTARCSSSTPRSPRCGPARGGRRSTWPT